MDDDNLVGLVLATYDDLSNTALAAAWGVSQSYVSQLRAGRRPRLADLTRTAARRLLEQRGVALDVPLSARDQALADVLAPAPARSADYYRGMRDGLARLIRAARELDADAAQRADAAAPAKPARGAAAGLLGAKATPTDDASPLRRRGR